MDAPKHALVAVCAFAVLVGALVVYRNDHGLGSFIPTQTDDTGQMTTYDIEPDETFLESSGDTVGITLAQGEVLSAAASAPRLVESLTKTTTGTQKYFGTLTEVFEKKEFVYADVLGIGGQYIASLTGSGLAIVKGKLACKEAEGHTMGCVSGDDLDDLHDKLDPSDIDSSRELLSLVGDATGSGLLVFNTNPTLVNLTAEGTSTFNGGLAVTGGCVSVEGVCLGMSTSTGSVADGLAGQVAYYATDGSVVSGTSSLFLASSGKVGVGAQNNGLHPLEISFSHQSTSAANDAHALAIFNSDPTVGNWSGIKFKGMNASSTGVGLAHIGAVSTSLTPGSESGDLAFYTRRSGIGYRQNLVMKSSGSIGIGTSTPSARLSVDTTDLGTSSAFIIGSSTGTLLAVMNTGYVGIGTAAPTSQLDIRTAIGTSTITVTGGTAGTTQGDASLLLRASNASGTNLSTGAISVSQDATGNTRAAYMAFSTRASGGTLTEWMRITNTGNIGIGTTTPSAQLTTTGSVQFSTFGAGSLQTDANGNLSVSSDERLKDIEGAYVRGLDAILGIEPISYRWKASTGFDTANVYTGFSAQNIQAYIPEAVGEDAQGFLSLSDRPILATIVNAIKEMRKVFVTERVETKQLCLEDVCVTKNELRELLTDNDIQPTLPEGPTSIPSDTTTEATSTAATSTEPIPFIEEQSDATAEPVPAVEEVPPTEPVAEQ